jgi:4-hydroxybenzoate polyprenyltransferase
MTVHTDIERGGWVGKLPRVMAPYAILARLDRPVGAWLLFLPGLWSILLARAPWPETLRLIVLFGVGSVVMRSAGCVVNDMWDRKIDRLVARTAARPLASGALSMRQAAVFLAGLLCIGLAILLSLNWQAEILGTSSLILVALYPAAKRVTWWPQAMLGITFGFGAPLGYVAATRHFDLAALLLYLAVFFWILGYDTIYAHQDREDDALVAGRL